MQDNPAELKELPISSGERPVPPDRLLNARRHVSYLTNISTAVRWETYGVRRSLGESREGCAREDDRFELDFEVGGSVRWARGGGVVFIRRSPPPECSAEIQYERE